MKSKMMLFAAIGICAVQMVHVVGQESQGQTAGAKADPMAGKTFSLSGNVAQGYHELQRNLTEAAQKMSDQDYTFRATPAVKPYGQLIAHVALDQFRTCSMLKGEANPRKDEKEETTRTKTEAIALLEASTRYCDPLVDSFNDAMMPELVAVDNFKAAKGLFPMRLVAHGAEMYGVMTVYLRLKGIVPPSTEKMQREMDKQK